MKLSGESTTALVPKVLVASLLRAVAPRFLEAVDDLPVVAQLEPLRRKWRTRNVPEDALEARTVAAVHDHFRVDVHAADLGERALGRTHRAHGLRQRSPSASA